MKDLRRKKPNRQDSGLSSRLPTTKPIPTTETIPKTRTEDDAGRPAIDSGRIRDIASRRDDSPRVEGEAKLTPEQIKKRDEELKQQAGFWEEILSQGMEIACERLPNPKPMTATEKKMFGETSKAAIEKYLPMASRYSVEAGLILSLALILVPRWRVEKPSA